MKITKRNGRKQEFNPQKILQRIKKSSIGLEVNPEEIFRKVIPNIQEDMTTTEIDESVARECHALITRHPDYGKTGARILMSRLYKLISDTTYLDRAGKYLSDKAIKNISQWGIPYGKLQQYDMEEREYISAYAFIQEYALKEKGQPIESPLEMYCRIFAHLLDNEQEYHKMVSKALKGKISLASPQLLNGGTKNSNMISCTSMSLKGDSREGIMETSDSITRHSKNSAGLGVYVGEMRSKETVYDSGKGKASGLVKGVKIFEPLFNFFRQHENRKGAGAITCDIWHRDIEDFIVMKDPNTIHSRAAHDLFYSVAIPNLFYKRVTKNEDWTLVCPKVARDYLGFPLSSVHGSAWEQAYEDIEKADIPKKVVNARNLILKLVSAQASSGVPYVYNRDNGNRNHNHNHAGTVRSQQLCVVGDTMVNTKVGYVAIQNLVGKQITIWNGFEWSDVTPYKVSDSETIWEVKFSDGDFMYTTAEHKWVIEGRTDRVMTKDLKEGYTLPDYHIHEGHTMEFVSDKKVVSVTETDNKEPVYCLTEPKNNTFVANGLLTGNCNEFLAYHDEENEAQCCLAAIPVSNHVKRGKVDFDSLAKASQDLTLILNSVIDNNDWNTVTSQRTGLQQRAIGIGIVGLFELSLKLNKPFGSEEFHNIQRDIQECIYYNSINKSCELVKEGRFKTNSFIKQSPLVSKGVFRFGVTPPEDAKQDWESLRSYVMTYGVANSLFCCNMPTSSTSKLLALTESFEPMQAPVVKRKVVSGEILVTNRFLYDHLKEYNLLDEQTLNQMNINGSVVGLGLPKEVEDLYLNIYELGWENTIKMAVKRQPYVDMGESMNMYFTKSKADDMVKALIKGAVGGLTSGVYYTKVVKKTTNNANLSYESKEQLPPKPENSPFECFGCST